MILGLFRRRDPNAGIIEALYEAVAAASRRPALYRDLGVPDTVDGRFEMMTLHAHLVVRRLRALPSPAGDLAQDLVDRIFAGFEAALRELGVGDIVVPKRMKTMASAFLGRSKAYEQALPDEAALRQTLARNVYNDAAAGAEPAQAGAGQAVPAQVSAAQLDTLVALVRETVASLETAGFEDFVAAKLPLPEPQGPIITRNTP